MPGKYRKLKGEPPVRSLSVYGPKPDKKAGRPKIEIDQELEDKVINMIKIGAAFDVAVYASGVSRTTFMEWCRIAKEDPASRCGEFLAKVHQAIAESEVRDIIRVETFAEGRPKEFERDPITGKIERDAMGNPIVKRSEIMPDFRAVIWRLERRHNLRWGPKAKLTVEDDSKQAEVEVKPTSEVIAELKDLTNALEAIEGSEDE
jgi:hypothetical protein